MWKLECDALTRADWDTLALMAVDVLPPFGSVFGVPRGGVPFAESLARYTTCDPDHPILIAEDICTTGGSMERYRGSLPETDRRYIGVCVFARMAAWSDWVVPLFVANPLLSKSQEKP